DLLPAGKHGDGHLALPGIDIEPLRRPPVDGVDGLDHGEGLTAPLPDGHDVALPHLVGGHVYLALVDEEVAVADELARLGTGAGEAGPVNHVVETGLEEPEQ